MDKVFNEQKHSVLSWILKGSFWKIKKHSIDEDRFFFIGKIESGIVTVRFTIRKKVIRLFGAGYWR